MKSETFRTGAGAALVVTGWGVLGGLLVGALWSWIAPRGQAVVRGDAVVLDPRSAGAFIAADGWFAVLAALAGLAFAVAAYVRFRWQPGGALIGLAIGGFLGAVVAWRIGHWLGPAPVSEQVQAVQNVAPDARFPTPLVLRAKGVLLFWPILAVVGYALLVAVTDRPDREESGPDGAQPDTIGTHVAADGG